MLWKNYFDILCNRFYKSILKILFDIEKEEAISLLKSIDMNLGRVIQDFRKRKNKPEIN